MSALKPIQGITAIEDRLQAGVPEAIQALRDAGLAVWVLTGDKLQTATEIGRSCNLIGQKDHVEFIKNDTRDKLKLQLAGLYSNVEDVRRFSKKKSRGDMRRCWSWLCEETPKLERIKGRVLVIDGKNLGWIFEDKAGFQVVSARWLSCPIRMETFDIANNLKTGLRNSQKNLSKWLQNALQYFVVE